MVVVTEAVFVLEAPLVGLTLEVIEGAVEREYDADAVLVKEAPEDLLMDGELLIDEENDAEAVLVKEAPEDLLMDGVLLIDGAEEIEVEPEGVLENEVVPEGVKDTEGG